jgi:hypothetical protein
MSEFELTPRQSQILRLIQDTLQETGMPPTRKEIAEQLGFKSPNAAEDHLRALARKGVISLVPGASRGIQLKDALREQLGLPLIGRVAAGRPILAEENIEARLQIDPAVNVTTFGIDVDSIVDVIIGKRGHGEPFLRCLNIVNRRKVIAVCCWVRQVKVIDEWANRTVRAECAVSASCERIIE